MRVMLCGPMTGVPAQDWPFFEEYEKQLRRESVEAVNPARLAYNLPENWGDNPQPPGVNLHHCAWDWYTRLIFILGSLPQCDAVYLMPGWNSATNSMILVLAAQALNLKILFHNADGELCEKKMQLISECSQDGVLQSASDLSLPDKLKEMTPEEYLAFKHDIRDQELTRLAHKYFDSDDEEDDDDDDSNEDDEAESDDEEPVAIEEEDISSVEELADGNIVERMSKPLYDVGEWLHRQMGEGNATGGAARNARKNKS